MTDNKDDNRPSIGFGAKLVDPDGKPEPRRVGFNAKLLDPAERNRLAYEQGHVEFMQNTSHPCNTRNLTATMNHHGFWHNTFRPLKLAAVGLATLACTTIMMPEDVGHVAGNFVSGFNAASEGNAICNTEFTACPAAREVGEFIGNVVNKVQTGYDEARTTTPDAFSP